MYKTMYKAPRNTDPTQAEHLLQTVHTDLRGPMSTQGVCASGSKINWKEIDHPSDRKEILSVTNFTSIVKIKAVYCSISFKTKPISRNEDLPHSGESKGTPTIVKPIMKVLG